jgi:hypothetical protein
MKGVLMRYCRVFILLTFLLAVSTCGSESPFDTHAKFSLDNGAAEGKCCLPAHLTSSLSSAVATIEPPKGPMRYSWVEINFYSFSFTRQDVAAARSGNTELLNKKWKAMDDPQAFNQGWASIQLALDAQLRIQQVNMLVPGYSCTVAILERDLTNFVQEYKFDGNTLRLKSKGSYLCDMKAQGLGTPKFGWDVDLTTTVFAKAPRAR